MALWEGGRTATATATATAGPSSKQAAQLGQDSLSADERCGFCFVATQSAVSSTTPFIAGVVHDKHSSVAVVLVIVAITCFIAVLS